MIQTQINFNVYLYEFSFFININFSLHQGRVHPESASSPVIPYICGQRIPSEAIAHFSDQVHIGWGPS